MPLLAEGIRIHGEKLTEQLKPLHDRLTACFKELKKKVEKQYGVITLVSVPGCLVFCLKEAQLSPFPHVSELVLHDLSQAYLSAASLPHRKETEQVRLCRVALYHVFHTETALCHICGVFCGLYIFHVI